jgi:hypothetical protein
MIKTTTYKKLTTLLILYDGIEIASIENVKRIRSEIPKDGSVKNIMLFDNEDNIINYIWINDFKAAGLRLRKE